MLKVKWVGTRYLVETLPSRVWDRAIKAKSSRGLDSIRGQNRHAGNDLVDSLRLAGLPGDSHSLVDMQRDPVANNLAFIEYDLAVLDVDHGSELVVEELVSATFDQAFSPARKRQLKTSVKVPLDTNGHARMLMDLLLVQPVESRTWRALSRS